MFFKNSEKTYNTDCIKNEIIRKITKSERTVVAHEISLLIDRLTYWYIERMNMACRELYVDGGDILDLANEDKKVLLDIFDQNNLFQRLNEEKTYESKLFICDDDFRRKILYGTLYNIISRTGKRYGAEYGLVFAKTYNFDLSIPMHYVSYENGITDKNLRKYVNTYIELGGPLETYVLPKYYDTKDRYDVEELRSIITYFNNSLSIKPYDVAVYAKNLKK